MVSSATGNGLVYGIKLSSVGPANVTRPDSLYEPGNMDLAMKLHYLRLVYYLRKEAFEGLTTLAIKEPVFAWLNQFPMMCGRFRRGESGRAYIKCNDCGVRFIEGKCDKSVDEWLQMKDVATVEKLLCSDKIIGPDLSFSPLVYIQLTRFKCGAVAMGLSWAHVLGDAFCAAEFVNALGRVVAGSKPMKPINLGLSPTKPKNENGLPNVMEDPVSIKRVDPVGDNWLHATPCNMDVFSFNVTPTQLSQLQSKLTKNGAVFPPFEALSALIWQCIARTRVHNLEPRVVTICKKSEQNYTYGILGNTQVVSVVKADFPIADANPSDLAALLQNEAFDDRKNVEEAMEKDQGLSDFIIYGANLTFVNLDESGFYDFEYRGEKPTRVSIRVDGVGENGVVLVVPEPMGGGGKKGGMLVTLVLLENEMVALKSELKRGGVME